MTTQTEEAPTSIVAKMSVPTLTAMVVGGMVGAGVFSLPAMIRHTSARSSLRMVSRGVSSIHLSSHR